MQKLLRVSENLLLFLVILLIVFVPLYPKLPIFNVTGTFVAIRVEDFLIAGALGLWGVYMLISGKLRSLINDKLFLCLGIFFTIGILSLFSGYFVTHTVDPKLGLLHYLRRVELMALLLVTYSVIRTKRQLLIILLVISLVTVGIIVYAFGQQYLDWPVFSTTNSEFSKGLILRLTPGARVNSTFAGHYDLAAYLAMFLTVLTIVFFAIRRIYWKALALLIGAGAFVVLVMTAARLSFVALVVGVMLSLILGAKRKFLIVLVIIAAVTLAYPTQLRDRFISTVVINIQKQGERYSGRTVEQQQRSKLNIPTLSTESSRSGDWTKLSKGDSSTASDITPGEPIDTTELGVYRSFQIRLDQEWPRAIRAFSKNPLIGTGYSSVGIAVDNDILRSLAEVGLLGTIAFTLILYEVVKRLFRILRNAKDKMIKYFAAGIISMIAAFIINGLFIDVFEASKVATLFWMFLGVSLACERMIKLDENS